MLCAAPPGGDHHTMLYFMSSKSRCICKQYLQHGLKSNQQYTPAMFASIKTQQSSIIICFSEQLFHHTHTFSTQKIN